MHKIITLSLILSSVLMSDEVVLETLSIEGTVISDVAQNEIKSGDVAETLSLKVPSISLVRRSGIANDIILRGLKKDNINILVDGSKTYGACPNRMDPPTSHVLSNNIDAITVIEGPYDVENFGTLGGAVIITTKKPKEAFEGEMNLNVGSFGYNKASLTLSGGNDYVRLLISGSGELSNQYRDGDGNTFAEQLENAIPSSKYNTKDDFRLQEQYRDMDAYKKTTFMSKLYVDITDNQELVFSYTQNRSSDVLYPSSKMDALVDDSDIFNLEYNIKHLSKYSKLLSFQYYDSAVDHPMSTKYRMASVQSPTNPMGGVVTSALTSRMQGAKVINTLDIVSDVEMDVGVDASKRNWDGTYFKNGVTMKNMDGSDKRSIHDVDTQNSALFTKFSKKYSEVDVALGLRYDMTKITPSSSDQQSNRYNALSANIFTTYKVEKNLSFFGGIGKSSRVPDARELYFKGSMGNTVGTDNLNQVTNYQDDLGMENRYSNFTIKTKVFYSMLEDYIVYNSSKTTTVMGNQVAHNAYDNVDATLYGMDVVGAYYFTDEVNIDFGAAYQRGQKNNALSGQTGTNLAEIPPLKGNIALSYNYHDDSMAHIETIGAASWDSYDAENGEQELPSWAIVNLKVQHSFSKLVELSVGANNIFDKTYAVSNTYNDLILLGDSTSTEQLLMNEPGRYLYTNLKIKF